MVPELHMIDIYSVKGAKVTVTHTLPPHKRNRGPSSDTDWTQCIELNYPLSTCALVTGRFSNWLHCLTFLNATMALYLLPWHSLTQGCGLTRMCQTLWRQDTCVNWVTHWCVRVKKRGGVGVMGEEWVRAKSWHSHFCIVNFKMGKVLCNVTKYTWAQGVKRLGFDIYSDLHSALCASVCTCELECIGHLQYMLLQAQTLIQSMVYLKQLTMTSNLYMK